MLHDRISSLEPGEHLTIVTRTSSEASDAAEYWKRQTNADIWSGISFMSFASFKAQKTPTKGRIVIAGWLGRDRMANVVYGYAAPIAELLLVQGCETNWYVNQSNAWKRSLINRDDTARVLNMPGVAIKGSSPLFLRHCPSNASARQLRRTKRNGNFEPIANTKPKVMSEASR